MFDRSLRFISPTILEKQRILKISFLSGHCAVKYRSLKFWPVQLDAIQCTLVQFNAL